MKNQNDFNECRSMELNRVIESEELEKRTKKPLKKEGARHSHK